MCWDYCFARMFTQEKIIKMDFDINFVRAQFPAFKTRDGQNLAFFENAGGSYPCVQVINRLERFYRERKMQPYWSVKPSGLGGEEMDEARRRLAALMNTNEDELSFGPSTTQNTYVLSQAFRQMMTKGDAIIVTNQDHEANSGPWRRLVDAGIKVREWSINHETGQLCLKDLENLLDEKVRLICFPHCSNIISHINPVKQVVKLARKVDAHTCVDGVSYAPHCIPDVKELGADIYLFSSYKTYGPHQGIMVIKRELAEKLPNQGHYFNAKQLSKRFTPAGPDHAQIAACAGIADYFDDLYHHHFMEQKSLTQKVIAINNLLRAREEKMMHPLLDYINGNNSMKLLGPKTVQNRAPTFAIKTQTSPNIIAERLAEREIALGAGNFYGVRPLKAMMMDPLEGVLRISLVHYNSEDEIARLILEIDNVL